MRVVVAGLLSTSLLLGCAEARRSPAQTTRALLGSATRPQLSADAAAEHTPRRYLAQAGNVLVGLITDDWDPTAGVGDVARFTPDFEVTAGGRYPSVQSAVDAAVALGGSARRYIELDPGTYREQVCVPARAPPITLYGRSPDASRVVIVFDDYSGKPSGPGARGNPCSPSAEGTTIGTRSSATFVASARAFQATNVSFVNDTDETAATSKSVQGVALTAQGDQQIYENVRVLGNQDSLFLNSDDVATVVRVYLKRCHVEGDTDFIFGRATAVLDGCTIHSLTSRKPDGVVLAPSTDARVEHGILVTGSTFSADATAAPASTHLGRAWDEAQVDVATYTSHVKTGIYPNGQAVVRNSVLGPHIQSAAPWRPAATTARPYSSSDTSASPANRLYEFENTSAPTAP
jgi:pectinesterase